jgi:hypothetical protein
VPGELCIKERKELQEPSGRGLGSPACDRVRSAFLIFIPTANVIIRHRSLFWCEFSLHGTIAERSLPFLSYTRERVPLDWAGTQNNLAGALTALGARESGSASLEEAIAAYRLALAVFENTTGPCG